MPSSQPLQGNELIDCAKANLKFGVEEAAKQCGYQDLDLFEQQLQIACEKIGVSVQTLANLISEQQSMLNREGIEIAPDSASEL